MVLLISGVALWWAAHLFKRLAPERRAALGDKGKALVAIHNFDEKPHEATLSIRRPRAEGRGPVRRA